MTKKETLELPSIFVVEGYDSIEDEDGNMGFGVYIPRDKQIYVAGEVPYEMFVKALFHELAHWVQDVAGNEFNEDEANDFAERVYEAIRNLPSAQPEYRLDEWCTDCKEYDQERHCCPRFNKVIRTTLNEMKSERKRGKWLRAGTHHGVQMYQCSECGAEEAVPESTNFQTGETSPVWGYCPYCGANMTGK